MKGKWGEASGTHGRGEKSVQRFLWESPKERDHLEDPGVDGRIVSECILGRLAEGCGADSVGSG
jgi:hypothetical protein